MTFVDWLCIALPGATLGWSIVVSALACLQPRLRRRVGELDASPPISVLVPVSSPATYLPPCVKSLLDLHHDRFEVLLVASADDAAAGEAVQREAGKSTRVRALILDHPQSSNPKVGLLAAALDHTQHELLMFTDDNTISSPTRFRSHLERFAEGYRLVSAPAVGVDATSFWGQVDAAFMNGYFARLQLAGDCIGFGGVTGKSMLVTRSDLERAGGLLNTGTTLCEDAALQRAIAQIGGRTGLSREPVIQPIGRRKWIEVWSRHRRWFFCRKAYVPWVKG